MSKAARVENRNARTKNDERFVMAWCYRQTDPPVGEFMDSVVQTMQRDYMLHGARFVSGGTLSMQSGPRIAEARTQLVEKFLTAPEFDGIDWLWMVDSDMSWDPDVVYPLILDTIDKDTCPILGGLCFAGNMDKHWPTLYVIEDEDLNIKRMPEIPENQLVKVDGTGAAFMLVHRSVLIKMFDRFSKQPNGTTSRYPWFAEGMINKKTGSPYGEDIIFCIRARDLGIPIYVHTGMLINHHKPGKLTLDSYKRQGPIDDNNI